MKILITGATGFIGGNIMTYLSDNFEVYGTTRQTQSSSQYIKADLLNLNEDIKFAKDFDVVIHCASILATEENHKDFNLLLDNLQITRTLVAQISEIKPRLVINFSSIGVYPNIDGTYNEKSQINPSVNFEGLYGLSKFASEEIFSFFFHNSDTRIINFRLGQTIGDGMRDDRIYSVMKKELEMKNSISVYGNGERTSGFLSIEYLNKTIEQAIKNKNISGTYNLTETNMSYLDLAKKIIREFGDHDSKIELLSIGTKAKISINSNKIKSLLDE